MGKNSIIVFRNFTRKLNSFCDKKASLRRWGILVAPLKFIGYFFHFKLPWSTVWCTTKLYNPFNQGRQNKKWYISVSTGFSGNSRRHHIWRGCHQEVCRLQARVQKATTQRVFRQSQRRGVVSVRFYQFSKNESSC